jgi:hypothetical protein
LEDKDEEELATDENVKIRVNAREADVIVQIELRVHPKVLTKAGVNPQEP